MKFGIDRLIAEPALRAPLSGRRIALLAHPASVTDDLQHSLDALAACDDMKVVAAFGPQHGLRGDKQDNMIESPTFNDPVHGIPVFSLYGEVRKPTDAMMDTFDVILVDLQDLGCRIYTFITTLRYILEAASKHRKAVWVLDRPNPVGRPVEGLTLRAGWQSFVGAGPLPMRHGLTLGELGCGLSKRSSSMSNIASSRCRGGSPTPRRIWPAAWRARMDQSQSQCAEFIDGARLRGHRDARGRNALGGARHHAAARIVRRARYRCTGRHEGNGFPCAAVAAGLPPARLLVAADVSQARGQALQRRADPHGRSQRTITRRSSLGGSRRSRSRRYAVCIRTIRCGAISLTNTSTASSPSMSSTAGRCCVNGWTMRRDSRRTWMRCPCRMSRLGSASGKDICATEGRLDRESA